MKSVSHFRHGRLRKARQVTLNSNSQQMLHRLNAENLVIGSTWDVGQFGNESPPQQSPIFVMERRDSLSVLPRVSNRVTKLTTSARAVLCWSVCWQKRELGIRIVETAA